MSVAAAFLFLAAAISGGAGMAIEMAASRLLTPFYGDSHLIWTNLIGLILAALTIGYYVGGIWADRWPKKGMLALLMGLAGLWTLAVPVVSGPLLAAVQGAFPTSQAGFVASSLISVLILFAPPTFLLGCLPPFAIRLALADVRATGRLAGTVYAVSTVGSMVGTFAPVLWLMPNFGVQSTFVIIAVTLLAVALLGLLLPGRTVAVRPATLEA